MNNQQIEYFKSKTDIRKNEYYVVTQYKDKDSELYGEDVIVFTRAFGCDCNKTDCVKVIYIVLSFCKHTQGHSTFHGEGIKLYREWTSDEIKKCLEHHINPIKVYE